MSDQSSPPDTLLPTWLKALVGMALFFLLAVGVVSFMGMAATNRWQHYATRLRAGGEPLTLAEIEAARATVPDEQNAARVIERMAARLDDVVPGTPDSPSRENVLVFGRTVSADFFKAIDRSTIEPSRAFLERHRDVVQELGALRDKPRGRFRIHYSQNPIMTLLPHTPHVRTAAKLLALDAAMQLIDRHMDRAADDAILLFHLAGTLHDEPLLISRLVQVSVEVIASRSIEQVLRVGEVDGATLAEVSAAVDDRLATDTLKWAVRGERAMLVGMCDEIAAGRVSMRDVAALGPGSSGSLGSSWWIPDVVVRTNERHIAEALRPLVDACDDPQAMIAAARKVNATAQSAGFTDLLLRMLLPSLSRAVELHLKGFAEMRCARVLVAAERYRLDHAGLPRSLDLLVPDYLDAIPSDPFADGPIRLVATEHGIAAYSVGPDRSDDGGNVTAIEGEREPRDLGCRLVEPDRRGLVIVDAPSEDD